MLYFSKKGYQVFGIDPEPSFIEHAFSLNLFVKQDDVLTFRPGKQFDAIWCSASLLHLKREDIRKALENIKSWMKKDRILFLSMKYSNTKREEIDICGRQRTYLNNEDINQLGFTILEKEFKIDSERDITWADLLLKKSSTISQYQNIVEFLPLKRQTTCSVIIRFFNAFFKC